MKIKIRKFQERDSQKVANIISRCNKEITSKDYPKKVIKAWDSDLTPEYIKNKSCNRICFVAVDDEIPVGYISLECQEIKKLHVNPDYHRRGIGKKLVNKIIKIAKNQNLKKIIVESSLGAEKFYNKCGFKKIMEVTKSINGVKFKLILMEQDLK